jgi:predicted ArsR family transcriptional regulator
MPKVPERETHRVLGSQSRVHLLEVLRIAGCPMSVSEASRAVGLHASTTRFHLELLVSVGLAERVPEQRTEPGRPKVLYAARADPGEPAGAGGDYQELAGLLADGLSTTDDPARAAVAAGERWAQALDRRSSGRSVASTASPATELGQLLAELGFDPDVDLPHGLIRLHRCPFEQVARVNRTVVCGVHLGMLRASLTRLGASSDDVALEPFVSQQPLLCLVHLRAAGQGATAFARASTAPARRRPPTRRRAT